MRILIENSCYEIKNIGDWAMLEVALQRIHTMFPEAELLVFTTNPVSLRRYFPEATPITPEIKDQGLRLWCQPWNILGGLHKLLPKVTHSILSSVEDTLRRRFPRLARLWIIYRFKKRGLSTEPMDRLLALITSVDYVICTGGGYITDSFSSHSIRLMQLLSLAQNSGRPTFLFGQGLGPLTAPHLIALCRQIFPKLDYIGLREGRASLPLALSLGASKKCLSVTGDDAIELAHGFTPPQLGDAIGINLRVATYSQVDQQILQQIREVVLRISDRLQAPLIPAPISFHDEESDIRSIEQILGQGTHLANQLDNPNKVIHQIGQCRLVVTGSYHAGVFALSQGISVVGLANSPYYRDKFLGLADQFKDGCEVVELSSNNFPNHLEASMLRAWHSAPENRTGLLNQAQLQVQTSRQAYNILQKMVRR